MLSANRRFFLLFLLAMSCSLSVINTTAESVNITYLRPIITTNTTSQYVHDQLTAALEHTRDDFGEYVLTPSAFKTNQKRGLRHLENNKEIDLMWTMTSRDREQKLLPVRVPLYKGLFGLRVCVVKLGDAEAYKIKVINETLAKSPNYIELKKVEQWNGVLPLYTGGDNIPMIDLRTQATAKKTC